jgi:signal transduction histidine kinase/ligand-binding sensor domain-containing protein
MEGKLVPTRPVSMPSTGARVRGGCRSVCLWWLLAVSCPGATALAQYRFDHWSADNGLPQNSVRDVIQTRDGYLWLTTFDGLVRFDGVRFTIFNKSNSPGIITNRFFYLYEDGQGDLWASTEDSGMTRLRQGRFTTYTTEHGLPANFIASPGDDGQGNLLLLFSFGSFRWLDGRFMPADELRLQVRGGQSDRVQRPPCFTDLVSKMVCFVDGQLRTWDLAGPHSPYKTLSHILQDGYGNIWWASEAGLHTLRGGRIAKADTINDALPGKSTRLVSGRMPMKILSFRDDDSLWLTDLDSMQSHLMAQQPPEGLKNQNCYADREGNYWFGTLRNGLYRARKQSVTAYSKTQGLIADEVYPICEDREGAIWIGTAGNGLYRFKDGAFSNYSGVPNSFGDLVYSLYQDRAGRLWVNGVWRFENGRFVRGIKREAWWGSFEFTWTMYEDHNGAFWIGTDGGALRYKDGAGAHYTTKDGLAGNDTKVIIEDKAGGIWLGSYGGLTHFKDGRFTKWTERDGLPGNTVRSLYQDGDGALWIGTYDSGLGRLKDGRFTRYTTKDGLFDNGVFQTLEDNRGWLWMSCNRGVYRVRKQELNDFAEGKIKAITSIAYGKGDGMANAECNGGRWPAGVKARDGKLWFPTMGGVVVIDPATVTTNAQPPPVIIEGVKIDNQVVTADVWESVTRDPRSAIRIEPMQKNFEIQYTALSFINSENLRFKYKLEGLDQDWVEAGTRRTAYFSHAPPGEYTFKVIASNSDGVWNTEGQSLRIVVAPPFYRTWWFLTLIGLGVAGLVLLIYEYRVRRLKRAQAEQQAFSRQLIASQESERKRIAAELHDSLGQSLLIIKNRAALGLEAPQVPHPAAEQLEEINTLASQAINEVRSIAYDLRPLHLDRLGLTDVIEEMIEKVAGASGIQFSADIAPLDGFFSKEDEINFYRIIQESVNNIIKHSQATRANVEVWVESGQVHISVSDNGRGFITDAQVGEATPQGLGLTGMTERTRMLGGAHNVNSAPGQGTTVSIRIPALKPDVERKESGSKG